MALQAIADAICRERVLSCHRLVGEGAFKETYLASDENEGRYALKVFRSNVSAARTDREIDAMQRCNHPNIVRLLTVASIEVNRHEHTYTLEEFLSGGTLASHSEKHGFLTNHQLLDVGSQLAEAIGHITGHDLVHRDIKPENILFRNEQTQVPVIVDFGLVRDLGRSPLTQTWALRGPGTPWFAAPEQLNNDRALIDWRTDQFALGLTLFLVRWGMHPFDRGNMRPDEVVAAVANREDLAPAAVELAKDEALTVLLKMLNPWPVRRFRRPDDLTAAIKAARKALG